MIKFSKCNHSKEVPCFKTSMSQIIEMRFKTKNVIPVGVYAADEMYFDGTNIFQVFCYCRNQCKSKKCEIIKYENTLEIIKYLSDPDYLTLKSNHWSIEKLIIHLLSKYGISANQNADISQLRKICAQAIKNEQKLKTKQMFWNRHKFLKNTFIYPS